MGKWPRIYKHQGRGRVVVKVMALAELFDWRGVGEFAHVRAEEKKKSRAQVPRRFESGF